MFLGVLVASTMAVRWLSVLAVSVVVLCSLHRPCNAAVISIDFGSEWVKVALVKVCIPLCAY